MSSSPLVVHIVRPYSSVEAYLDAEAWTIETRSMLLVDAAELPLDTAVLFDVALASGEKLIRAEGKVSAVVPSSDGKPVGLRVKFKRYGATTKAFIDRAASYPRKEEAPPPAPAPELPSAPEQPLVTSSPIATTSPVASPAPVEPSPAPDEASPAPVEAKAEAKPDPAPDSSSASSSREPSGVHRRPLAVDDVPPNRDALLARLRERARHVDFDSIVAPRKNTG